MKRVPDHQEGSGNVFADLGLANAPELQAKADLAWEIAQTIEERGLTQAEAAQVLGIDQPKVSALIRGRLAGFSMERLYRLLNALGKEVEIVVRTPATRRVDPGIHVVVANRKRSAEKRGAANRKTQRHKATS
jgi:predicted XRE-type DNA-binding protein